MRIEEDGEEEDVYKVEIKQNQERLDNSIRAHRKWTKLAAHAPGAPAALSARGNRRRAITHSRPAAPGPPPAELPSNQPYIRLPIIASCFLKSFRRELTYSFSLQMRNIYVYGHIEITRRYSWRARQHACFPWFPLELAPKISAVPYPLQRYPVCLTSIYGPEGEHIYLEYRAKGPESICGSAGFYSIPPFRQGRTADFAFNSATIGANVRPNKWRVESRSSTLSNPSSETCTGCGNLQKSTRLSSSRSAHMSPKCFPRFASYSQAASLTLMSNGSSLEMINLTTFLAPPTSRSYGANRRSAARHR
ncbi:hypothetical protein EVAR_29530_1 [Eumeta japonica]|uniref:Uncharacterized protein n=1 Tax=Eumeta variegata TaxID=151549 RepID=A0A4C1WIF2_EUMVA|nr:hypothetical protein EVAR_29530_1 [Eumeta japonica]